MPPPDQGKRQASITAISNDLSNFRPEECLTSEELIELRLTFELLDEDGNGTITVRELEHQMKKYASFSAEEMDRAISKIDVNNDGEISFEEFALAKALAKQNVLRVNDVKELERHFRLFDSDDSGTIEMTEIMGVLKDMGMAVDDQTLKAVMNSADMDGDGEIDLDEFIELTKGVYTLTERKFELCTMKARFKNAKAEADKEWKELSGGVQGPLPWPFTKSGGRAPPKRARRGSVLPMPPAFNHVCGLHEILGEKERALKKDMNLQDDNGGIAGMLQLYKSYMMSFRTSESVLDSLCELMRMLQLGKAKDMKVCLGSSGRQCDVSDDRLQRPDVEMLKKKNLSYDEWVQSVMTGSAIFNDSAQEPENGEKQERRGSVSTRSMAHEKMLKQVYQHYSRKYATDKVNTHQMGAKAWEKLCLDINALASIGAAECNTLFMTFSRTPIGGVDLGDFKQTNDPNHLSWAQWFLGTTKLLELMEGGGTLAGRELELIQAKSILKHATRLQIDPLVEELTEAPVKSMLFRRLWTLKWIFNHYATGVDGQDASGPSGNIGLKNLIELFKNFHLLGIQAKNSSGNAASVSQESISRAFHAVEPAQTSDRMEDTMARKGSVGMTSTFARRGSTVFMNKEVPVKTIKRPRLTEQGNLIDFAGFVEVICRCSLLFFPLRDVQQQIKMQEKNANLVVFGGNSDNSLVQSRLYISQNLSDYVKFSDEHEDGDNNAEGDEGQDGEDQAASTGVAEEQSSHLTSIGPATPRFRRRAASNKPVAAYKIEKKGRAVGKQKKKKLLLEPTKKKVPYAEQHKTRIISPRSLALVDKKQRFEQKQERKLQYMTASGTPKGSTANREPSPWGWASETASSPRSFWSTDPEKSSSQFTFSPRPNTVPAGSPRGANNKILRVGGAPPTSPRGTDKSVHKELSQHPEIIHSVQATMPTATEPMHLPQRQKKSSKYSSMVNDTQEFASQEPSETTQARVPHPPSEKSTYKTPWQTTNHSFPRYSRAHSPHGGVGEEEVWATQTTAQSNQYDTFGQLQPLTAPMLQTAPRTARSTKSTAKKSSRRKKEPENNKITLRTARELRDDMLTKHLHKRENNKLARHRKIQDEQARTRLQTTGIDQTFWSTRKMLDTGDSQWMEEWKSTSSSNEFTEASSSCRV